MRNWDYSTEDDLRAEITRLQEDNARLQTDVEKLRAEVAKTRGLVCDMCRGRRWITGPYDSLTRMCPVCGHKDPY